MKSVITSAAATSVASVTTANGVVADAGARISVWVRFSSVAPATPSQFLETGPAGGGGTIIGIGLNTNGTLRLSGNGTTAVNGTKALSANTWYRITLTYAIASASNWQGKVFINGVSEVTSGNGTTGGGRSDGTLGQTGTSTLEIGFNPTGEVSGWGTCAVNTLWVDDIYADNGTTLDDPGDVRVTAKRPVANGTLNQFTTQIGSSGSGYGSGHAPQSTSGR